MTKAPKNLNFEQAMERLDALVHAMESGEIGIEDSIAKYEEAMQLASRCRTILEQSEQRIKKIQIDSAGTPRAEPFDAPPNESDASGERT